MDAGPDIYEYPSETSLMVDDLPPSPPQPAQVGHTVPILGGEYFGHGYLPTCKM